MAERTIVWTKTADLQFVGVLEYWVDRTQSTAYSERLIDLVEERTAVIAQTPYAFKKADHLNTRVAIMQHYSIYYKAMDSIIFITAFWDNRQNPDELLKILERP